jgi:hypothetical protein
MKLRMPVLALVLASAGLLAAFSSPLSAQRRSPPSPGGPNFFSVGVSAGAGAIDNKRLFDSWDFGPVFGARLEWFRGNSSWLLYADVQPFSALRSNMVGDFKAFYIMPSYVMGPPGFRIGVAAGMGVFDLTSEEEDDERVTAFVPSLFGSRQLYRSLSLEFAWKRIANVKGMRADLFTLQLVQDFRF